MQSAQTALPPSDAWKPLDSARLPCLVAAPAPDPKAEPAMSSTTYPSPVLAHRRADMAVHAFGLVAIVIAGAMLLWRAGAELPPLMLAACVIYVACALASNLASCTYHFAPWHDRRVLLRRIDHAAIYLSITGTFTPLLAQAGTTRTYAVLALCWALSGFAIWRKITSTEVKSKWSTASYLGLGAIGLSAIPDLSDVPRIAVWCILAGSGCYVIGTAFYARKGMPYRYSIWHTWVSLGGMAMFAGVWLALF